MAAHSGILLHTARIHSVVAFSGVGAYHMACQKLWMVLFHRSDQLHFTLVHFAVHWCVFSHWFSPCVWMAVSIDNLSLLHPVDEYLMQVQKNRCLSNLELHSQYLHQQHASLMKSAVSVEPSSSTILLSHIQPSYYHLPSQFSLPYAWLIASPISQLFPLYWKRYPPEHTL